MTTIIRRIRSSEIWPWFLALIGMFAIAIESAFAMSSPDRPMRYIGGSLFLFGLCNLIWGLCMTEDSGGPMGVPNRIERSMPGVFIDWGPYTIVRWGHAITVGTLVVYAALPVWQVAVAVSVLVMLVSIRAVPAVCRFFIPRYYMWLGEGRLHETHVCEPSPLP